MTATVILKKKKAIDDFGYLAIRYFDGSGNKKVISLKERILETDFQLYFDASFNQFKKTFPNHRLVNKKIMAKLDDTSVFDVKVPTSSIKSFITYFSNYLDLLPNQNTKYAYGVALSKLKSFRDSKGLTDILFTDIDNRLVLELRNYFLVEVSPNTAKQYLIVIKTVLNISKREGLYVEKFNYFSKLNITTNHSNKKVLSLEDIKKLLELHKTDKFFDTRTMLLFSMLCSGIRVSDLFLITNKDINFKENYIEITTKKTSVNLKIPFNDKLIKMLLDIYDLPDYSLVGGTGYGIQFNADENILNVRNFVYNIEHLASHISSLPPNDFLFSAFVGREKVLIGYSKLKEESLEQNLAMNRLRALYNDRLRKMRKYYNLDVGTLSSHTGRYSWTNLLLGIENVNIIDIQRSLGHKKLTSTISYLDRNFSLDKLTNIGTSLSDKLGI